MNPLDRIYIIPEKKSMSISMAEITDLRKIIDNNINNIENTGLLLRKKGS
jgi:hypothetical protein